MTPTLLESNRDDKIKIVSINMLITTTGTENFTDTRDCLTFNQKVISASVLMS